MNVVCVDAQWSGYKDCRVIDFNRDDAGKIWMRFKRNIADRSTYERDEWGPWVDAYVDITDSTGAVRRNQLVQRSKPGGFNIMLKYPNIANDPGLEPLIDGEEWHKERVFRDLTRNWSYSGNRSKEQVMRNASRWRALGEWHNATHITHGDNAPVSITTADQGEQLRLTGEPVPWRELWRGLKRFADQPETSAGGQFFALRDRIMNVQPADSASLAPASPK